MAPPVAEPFLNYVCQRMLAWAQEHALLPHLHELALVLPTRRACLVAQRTLSQLHPQPLFSPWLGTLSEWAIRPTGLAPAEELDKLWAAVSILQEQPGLDSGAHLWGLAMELITEWEEVTGGQSLTEVVLQIVADVKSLDAFSEMPEEFSTGLRQFWQVVHARPADDDVFRRHFLELWAALPQLYSQYYSRLNHQGLTTPQQAARLWQHQDYAAAGKLPYRRVWVAGLSRITHAEATLIDQMHRAGLAEVMEDLDDYYVNQNSQHEAGLWARRRPWREAYTPGAYIGVNQPLQLQRITAPNRLAQLRWLAGWLTAQQQAPDWNPAGVLIVLLDEQLLEALPLSLRTDAPLNVSMGYPLRFTGLWRWLMQWQHHAVVAPAEMAPTLEAHLIRALSQDTPPTWLTDDLGREACLEVILALRRWQSHPHRTHLAESDAWPSLLTYLAGLRITLSGEPLQGLPVMQLLETRALDYPTVVFVAAEEGLLPPDSAGRGIIPYALRRAYELPTPEEHQAETAYLVYRLLHRARQVLWLDSPAGTVGGSQGPSRYWAQFQWQLAQAGRQVMLSQHTVQLPYEPALREPMRTVPQTQLAAYAAQWLSTTPEPAPEQRTLSPSQWLTLLTCPLQFYYHYVLRLNDPTETESSVLGNWVHQVLQALYTPYVGQLITPEVIDVLTSNLEAITEAQRPWTGPEAVPQGISVELLKRVTYRLALRSLMADRRRAQKAPFVVHALERPLHRAVPLPEGQWLHLSGKADRLDQDPGTGLLRVVDYKTGQVNIPKPGKKPLAEMLQPAHVPTHKELLQTGMYAFLLHPQPMTSTLVHVYALRKNEPDQEVNLNEHLGPDADQLWQQHLLQSLSPLLVPMHTEIKPYPEKKRCGYCSYHRLCYLSGGVAAEA